MAQILFLGPFQKLSVFLTCAWRSISAWPAAQLAYAGGAYSKAGSPSGGETQAPDALSTPFVALCPGLARGDTVILTERDSNDSKITV